jgi:hypothetical protein
VSGAAIPPPEIVTRGSTRCCSARRSPSSSSGGRRVRCPPIAACNSNLRVAARIVTGVGFIGAGAIPREGINVPRLDIAAQHRGDASVLGDGRGQPPQI